MNEKNAQIDIINDLLEDCLLAFPVSSLLISLYQQYQRRGFLTKKQLQALYIKASKASGINPGKLATLEAIISKMPNRFRSPEPERTEISDTSIPDQAMVIIEDILARYPQHKRVLFLKSKIHHNEPISNRELEELQKFRKALQK